jgi:hypothetical protein
MIQIDSRLQPLFVVMNDAGFDWIVSEILESLRQGHPRLASKNELESIRAKIDHHDETPEDVPADSEFVEPIVGDDQIDFVVNLVRGRFEEITGMLEEASKNLRLISATSESPAAEPKIAFQVDDEIRFITSKDTADLSEHINRLNANISAWAESVRTTGDPQ